MNPDPYSLTSMNLARIGRGRVFFGLSAGLSFNSSNQKMPSSERKQLRYLPKTKGRAAVPVRRAAGQRALSMRSAEGSMMTPATGPVSRG